MDLYTPSEYPFLYWYLARIFSEQIKTLKTFRSSDDEETMEDSWERSDSRVRIPIEETLDMD